MKKIVIAACLLLLVLIFSLFLYRNNSQVTGKVIFPISGEGKGQIYSMAVNPEVKVSEEATSLVGAHNSYTAKYSYKLFIYLVKEGVVKESSEFEFTLEPNRGTTFSFTFVPDTVGEHEIVAKLYDKFETELFDVKSIKTNSTSDIGPFDLFLEPLTRTIGPAEILPVILKMLNTGKKGSEVNVRVSMKCASEISVNDFYIFLKPETGMEKMVSLASCEETGLKKIAAEVLIFNTTFARSSSQVFVRDNPKLEVKVPEKIEVKIGESKILTIIVQDTTNLSVNNLKLAVEGIPSDWLSTIPDTIVNIQPGAEAIFLLNVSIPKDAEEKGYPVKIYVGGDEVFGSKEAVIRAFGAAIAPIIVSRLPKLQLPQAIKNKNLLFIIILAAAAFFIIRRMRANYQDNIYQKRFSALNAIRR